MKPGLQHHKHYSYYDKIRRFKKLLLPTPLQPGNQDAAVALFFKLSSHLTQADFPGGLCTLGEKILRVNTWGHTGQRNNHLPNDRTVKHSHNRNFSVVNNEILSSEEIFYSSEQPT